MENQCKSVLGWKRCKFEPRYDLGPAETPQIKITGESMVAILDRFRKKTYVHDICVSCGKIVARS